MSAAKRPLICDEVVERLWPYVDNALPASDRDRIADHLATCHDCTSHFDFARKFLDAVHDSDAAAAPGVRDELRSRVLDALKKEGFSRG